LIKSSLKPLLEAKVQLYNNKKFIAADPISIPHQFTLLQDIEIAAFFAAILAWGNRTSIINSCNKLMQLFNNAPHDFMLHHQDADLKSLLHFKHRTFTPDDLLYFIHFLNHHYTHHQSLETAFTIGFLPQDANIENGLNNFYNYFFSLPHLPRTHKHIAAPFKNSACKRLNMFLRWMVRQDNCGVDFGIWKTIKPSQLICPIDVHVSRVANNLGLLQSTKTDWQTAVSLTQKLKIFDSTDPCKYDFALFSMGVIEGK
jgi:uncharacterized protein (TIGR02757 family)